MAFVVDGSQWTFDGVPPEQVRERIDQFLAVVGAPAVRAEPIWIGEDFQSRPMLGHLDIWALFGPDTGLQLPRDLLQELTAWLNTARYYADEDWPEGLDEFVVEVAGEAVAPNSDIAWAHHWRRQRRAVGCLSLERSGLLPTSTAKGVQPVYFVNDEEGARLFWRDAIVVEGDGLDTLQRFAARAYPRIYFADGVLGALAGLPGGFIAIRPRVKHALGILDDQGAWTFSAAPPALRPEDPAGRDPLASPSNQIIEQRFRGFGIEVAPENPNVYRSGAHRRAREITIGATTLYCEWHVKLEPHRNRMHIHAPIAASGGRVVVAIIHEHLPLP